MNNEKITSDMNVMDMMMVMSEGNPGVLTVLIEMMQDPKGFLDILLLDTLDIRGSKIYKLYSDSCGKNEGKFNRTLMALRCLFKRRNSRQFRINLCLTFLRRFNSNGRSAFI